MALGLAAEGRDVTLVSKDMPLRVKAAVGRPDRRRVPPRPGQRPDLDRHGRPGARPRTRSAGLYAGEDARAGRGGRDLPCHTGLVLHSPRGSALGRVNPDKSVRLVRGDREAFGLRGRSAEQRIALDLLLDESIGIVSLGGRAGTGKSALALCAGPRGDDGAQPPQEGDRVPPAVRGRRPGAGLPAGHRVGEDVAVGAGGLRHARRGGARQRDGGGHGARACSRCCR